MKKIGLALILCLAISMPALAGGVGNLCDSKFLFKMNIIGVEKGKNPPMNNTSRKTIFVRLGSNGSPSKSTIWLTQGPFSVCDGNSWDQAYDCNGDAISNFTGSTFQLPCNLNIPADFACDGGETACYDIYFRALGTPGGGVTITTCGILSDGTKVCSSENTGLISRGYGTPKFTKVTNELSSLVGCVDVGGNLQCGRYALFRNEFQYFLWEYDNQGLRNGMVIFCGAECD
ncbi:hypothetical protein L0222_23310 [bacterium]|nr:hypothetical protein [bacterium]MCI0602043.1 hypothetical protein [bacterium]